MSSYENWNKKDYKSLKFTEIGPYVWDETRFKTFIQFNNDSDKVSYREEKQYVFNEKESVQNGKQLNKTDLITIINPILVIFKNKNFNYFFATT